VQCGIFLSTALYPLWKMAEASILLHDICAYHPFSHATEWIRFALYGQANLTAAVWIKTGFIGFFSPAFGAIALIPPSSGKIESARRIEIWREEKLRRSVALPPLALQKYLTHIPGFFRPNVG
jgi:hypothetical protein